MVSVFFSDLGRKLEAPEGSLLLEVCEQAGIPMDAACGGFAACNTCRVRVESGSLGEVDDAEFPFLDRDDQRLACQARLSEDVQLRLDPGA